ncbi:hypothetical protein Y032_0221g2565 [Ancylostoma ceylanicum]|uniref:Endonuclease/exonuclease/phosphatase domain-containing protein n=1 Tax=Ancylostoma ceylanicum TaxID=53326 RepID=A0A016SJ40_9BILA|nr:hypothetical protein Y032_0221g2565 [Ancylostoma ceylanicum]
MKQRRIRVLCLQETRWKGCKAKEIGDGIKLFYHGLATKNSGVAIAVAPPLKDYVASVTRMSERIISIRIATEKGFWTVVSAYAPQCGCNEIEKAVSYDELDNVIRNVPESDYLTMVMSVRTEQDSKGYTEEEASEVVIKRRKSD